MNPVISRPALFRLAALLGLTACLWSNGAAFAETNGKNPPTTFEAQVEYLEGALAESLRSRDWKMLELATEGFKAGHLNGTLLEISVLRAELQASFEAVQFGGRARAQIETWGLAACAKAGEEKALVALRTLAASEISAVQAPSAELWKKQPAEFKAAQKACATYVLANEKREHALLCLALLKEPGVTERALAILRARQKPDANPMGMGMGGDSGVGQLVLAALASDATAAWKGLSQYLGAEDEKASVDTQIAVLNFLLDLANPDPRFKPADDSFKVDRDIAAQLPKDSSVQLTKPFMSLAKRWKPDANVWNCPLLASANRLPVQPENGEVVAALEGLKSKLTGQNSQHVRQQIDAVVKKMLKVEAKDDKSKSAGPAVKPPRPPEEF